MAEHQIIVAIDIDALVLECRACNTMLTVWKYMPDHDPTPEELVELAAKVEHKPIETTATEIVMPPAIEGL